MRRDCPAGRCVAGMGARMNVRVVSCFFACVVTLASAGLCAQEPDFPNRPLRIIVPTSPGGILDTVMRLLAPKLSEVAGQNVVIDNRTGAATIIGTEIGARAAPNGYTMLTGGQPLAVNPSLYKKLPYNVEKDLAPISLVVSAPYILLVHASVPAKSVQEFLALARAKPGSINYSSGGNGTNFHIAVELLKNLTGVNLVHVPYRSGGLALAAVVSGEAAVTIASLVTVIPHVKTGRVRALAITSMKRSPVVPELPTVQESGVPDYEFTNWVGLLAPAGTSPKLLSALNGWVVKAARDPAVVERFGREGLDVIASSQSEFAAHLRKEFVRWAKVIKESGIRAE